MSRMPAIAAILAILALVAVATYAARGGGGREEATRSSEPSLGAAASPAASGFRSESGPAQADETKAASGAGAAAQPAPPGGQGAPATGDSGGENALPQPNINDRKIARTATLEIVVDDVAAAVQRVEAAALSVQGFVSGSTVFTSADEAGRVADERRQTATVTIRVPALAYPNVMNELRGIAKEVKSEKSQASEVTEQYTDLEARLRNLQKTRDQYLVLLGKAQSIQEILTVQDRLNSTELQIEQTQGRLNVLSNMTELSTITVQIYPPELPGQQQPATKSWASEAWENAWEVSEDALRALGTAAITAGVIAVWVLIPGLVLLALWRALGPRREGKGEV